MSTTKCLNCGKDIETYKMVLHERFCSLNVRKCSICEEPVQIDEYAEHKNLKHSEKSCEKCGKKFPASHFDAHLKSCSKKLIECQYCGLPMDPNEIREHEYQCGSKSKQCEYCGMNVPIMEYELHLEYACTIKQQFEDNNNFENFVDNTKYSNHSNKSNNNFKINNNNNNSPEKEKNKDIDKDVDKDVDKDKEDNVVLEKWEKSPSHHSINYKENKNAYDNLDKIEENVFEGKGKKKHKWIVCKNRKKEEKKKK
jgi:hypothetical protein